MSRIYVAIIVYGKKSGARISNILTGLKIKNDIFFPEEVPENNKLYTHIILSGGPKYIYDIDNNYLPNWVVKSKAPVLGIGYGMQLIVGAFGGKMKILDKKENGIVKIVTLIEKNGVLLEQVDNVWMNRYDGISELPYIFEVLSVTENGDIAAITELN